jgi:transcriptional repressor NrdR
VHCPFCHADDTQVIDTRVSGEQVRRRRECKQCKARFTTYESVERQMPRVLKRDGTWEAFSEEKLRRSLEIALQKRPVKSEEIELAIQEISRILHQSGEKEVPSTRIGDLAMSTLQRLDSVAYVRYASVYLSFSDLTAFQDLLLRLTAKSDLS